MDCLDALGDRELAREGRVRCGGTDCCSDSRGTGNDGSSGCAADFLRDPPAMPRVHSMRCWDSHANDGKVPGCDSGRMRLLGVDARSINANRVVAYRDRHPDRSRGRSGREPNRTEPSRSGPFSQRWTPMGSCGRPDSPAPKLRPLPGRPIESVQHASRTQPRLPVNPIGAILRDQSRPKTSPLLRSPRLRARARRPRPRLARGRTRLQKDLPGPSDQHHRVTPRDAST